ncbi:FAD-dependent oxidoreductase [Planktothrix agardhii]|jgi:Succinate dehydrogenase/fumarate reductase, flavoprotein subunit|uniref:FAD-dependent pyridine nucleotide-disulfide oxidoreductase n=1 Tax=Planktothrix agardhii TaxID=1160 RepID=A0AAD1V5E1_PLAAG|nr:FAD-dependent oxidoreductase [Planktothrix agardhii]MCB8785423.1 FAD-dependent oxidoreductase [Planktothrix agardhii 1025]MCF3612857.1 FAD-dependent oxidoreductase [Planktothrix agardhii 1027]MCP9296031.1 FAD-dependent oxidoreductase [Planktothrix agardhii LY1]MEA5560916.1 FAD-dependent oxidoreductase [Planktothrix agardhii UHCC 0887]CAD5937133.1 FAD-dependent pyridine nucleotide-disulfide oxidoreductase [Planktothrix agardhii]
MNHLQADVLVVGGGTGGTAAALQAARRGAKTILVSQWPMLGGMLTSAGVVAPDGNELAAFQTGIWGAFLRELNHRQPQGLDNAWVSFFTYHPQIGANIFADWVKAEPNLLWIPEQQPLEVIKQGNKITEVRFNSCTIHAKIILDGTELGDLLELAEIPYRWGWEPKDQWQEPSAPVELSTLMKTTPPKPPVHRGLGGGQAPTWVFIMQDFGEGNIAPEIDIPPIDTPELFTNAWQNYDIESFLNYGRLPDNKFMINWPIQGNDYDQNLDRLIGSNSERLQFWQESFYHSLSFARFIQTKLGSRYGLATGTFPIENRPNFNINPDILSAFALHPYYRESRRIEGLKTIIEQDILPIENGYTAPLPLNEAGECEAIAIGNYANDHHYTQFQLTLQPKSLRWGGRWTGTPFTIPYRASIPINTDNLLVCEKNICVSHIANGATRLQPVVLGIGQAAGMAAALCIEQGIQPQELSVRTLQNALLTDIIAPQAVIPLFNLPPDHPDWLHWQYYYLEHPELYPIDGNCPASPNPRYPAKNSHAFEGIFQRQSHQDYRFTLTQGQFTGQTWKLVTLYPEINEQLQNIPTPSFLKVFGRLNFSGNWLILEGL